MSDIIQEMQELGGRLNIDDSLSVQSVIREITRLRDENTILRGLIQTNSNWKCTYGYAVEHMVECPLGFPGCGCADDRMGVIT